ncbi:MAG: hypothetical protein ACJ8FS_16380 [Sphingomicrobium sp.]
MFAFLLPFASSLVGPKFAKPAIFGALGLLILLALWGGKCVYDHSIIAAHDAKIEASQAKADRKADNNLATHATADTARQNQEADQLTKVQQNAKTEHDRRIAFHKCLGLQQRARANGLQPPTCV